MVCTVETNAIITYRNDQQPRNQMLYNQLNAYIYVKMCTSFVTNEKFIELEIKCYHIWSKTTEENYVLVIIIEIGSSLLSMFVCVCIAFVKMVSMQIGHEICMFDIRNKR